MAIGIVAAAAAYYRSYERQFRQEIAQQLSAIAGLKSDGLAEWRSERLADGKLFFDNPDFSSLARRWREAPADVGVTQQMQAWMEKIQRHGRYDQVCWLDADGVPRLVVPAGAGLAAGGGLPDSFDERHLAEVTLVDFYRDKSDGRVHLAVWVPVFAAGEGGRPLGGLVLRIDPDIFVYPFIVRWPVPSASAETLLVRRDGDAVLFLNELRFRQGAALAARLPLSQTEVPAVQAVLGRTGIVEGRDYRASAVLAEVRAVPASPWFLVTRMDRAEAFAPLRARLWGTVVFAGVLLLTAGAGLGLAWRQQRARFYRERLKALEALRESERFLWESQSIAGIGSYALDLAAGRWQSSAVLDAIFGIDANYERSVAGWTVLIHPDDRARLVAHLTGEVLGQHRPFDQEYRILRPADGGERWVHGLGHLEFDEQGRPTRMMGTIQDITERQRAEAVMRESEEKFRTLFEGMSEGVALHEVIHGAEGPAVDYRILTVNPAFERHTGISRQAAAGQRATVLYGMTPPPYLAEFARVAGSGVPEDFETFFPGLDKYFRIAVSSPKRGMFATVFEDVSVRRRQEKELHEKNAELERFTYTVSHDLKSPLITIKGFAGALLQDVAAGRHERLAGDLRRVSDAADKMGQLLNDLLELSRIGRMVRPPAEIELDGLVRDVLALLAGPIGRTRARIVVQPGLRVVRGDGQRLGEVWQNLIENALKFTGGQPEPCIEIGVRETAGERVFFVRDNGAGIEPRYHETVFGLFNKLNAKSDGTGIGLALVRRIVEVHGGRIWIESEGLGHGTTCCFTLSANPSTPKSSQP